MAGFPDISGSIAVVGAGSWGTTLAAILSEKGYDVTLWAHEPEVVQQIARTRVNHLYLPETVLPSNLHATGDPVSAVRKARYVISVVPTQFVRSVFSVLVPSVPDEALVVSASKGVEIGTLETPSGILTQLLRRPVSVLSGPSFAREVISKRPTAVTLATQDRSTGLVLQELLNTDFFRVYTHDDTVGAEIGGALKNVIAIASGICDGLGLGHNARAALITRGLSEISRLGVCMGAREVTFFGLSGLGDLVLTCTGPLSRNYTVGYELGKGRRLADIVSGTQSIAEGVTTSLSAYELSRKNSVEMPITEQVYLTLYRDKSPAEAVLDLMNRSLKAEFNAYS